MRELPIPFSTQMVRAILEGRKSMTRRCAGLERINEHPDDYKLICWQDGTAQFSKRWANGLTISHYISDAKPCYRVGDHLWCRETWALSDLGNVYYKADDATGQYRWMKWKSGRFMFKKYARLWLGVTAVKAERLQEISEEDALAEGVTVRSGWRIETGYRTGIMRDATAIDAFIGIWDSINGKTYPWESNPWVWCYSFKRIARNQCAQTP